MASKSNIIFVSEQYGGNGSLKLKHLTLCDTKTDVDVSQIIRVALMMQSGR